jgi:hypothetical protein
MASTSSQTTAITDPSPFQIVPEAVFLTSKRLQSIASRKSVGFFRGCTAASNGTWFSPHSSWDDPEQYPSSKIPQLDSDYELNQMIGNLMAKSRALDESLLDDLQGAKGFHLSRLAYKEIGRIEAGSGLDWTKDLFNSLLLDRFLWVKHCIDHPDEPIPFPLQLPHDKFPVEESGLQEMTELEKNWPNTAIKFAEAWQNRSLQATDNDSPVWSLYSGIKKSDKDLLIAKVTKNFCQIALIIRSILIVSCINRPPLPFANSLLLGCPKGRQTNELYATFAVS